MSSPRYRIELTRAAARQLAALPKEVLKRVDEAILALALDPFPQGSKKLRNGEGRRRIRVGQYRVIYSIENDRLVILVIRVGHRREVYRGL
jgi:mRNA interferase RelE/StbE